MTIAITEANLLLLLVDGTVEDQFRSVDMRFDRTNSLHHTPFQLRHGLVPTHLPLLFNQFDEEGRFTVEWDYTSRHHQTLTLHLLISTLPAVRYEGAGERIDERVDSLPEFAQRAKDEDSDTIRCYIAHFSTIRHNGLQVSHNM